MTMRHSGPRRRSDPAVGAVTINYAATDQTFTKPTRGLYISGAGALVVIMSNGDSVTFTGLLAGVLYPIAVKTIVKAGSSAAGLVLT